MKLFKILCIAGILSFSHTGYAQQLSSNTVFVELLGNGGTISINYDKRFSKSIKGWGSRIGFGYFGDDKEQITTVPAMVNYLSGRSKHHLELGGGVMYVRSNSDFLNIKDGAMVGAAAIMYRYQSPLGGFMWKIGLTPIIISDGIIPYWAGVAAGYTF